MKKQLAALVLLTSTLISPLQAKESDEDTFGKAVRQTVAMVHDQTARSSASQHGLNIVNVTWEDTGRYKGSTVGPNISDMTLQVQMRHPDTDRLSLHCLPVIRHPNFSDKTADLSPDNFFLLVGNQKGKKLQRVSLRKYLEDPRNFMSNPDSWSGPKRSLFSAERDEHVLVSAQACFLPIPKGQEVEFNPVLFNYQSVPEDPAVLTILATRQGTSMTVIDNKRDGFSAGRTWGQRLFFNKDGERASLTGKRLSDHLTSEPKSGQETVQAAGEEGLNMVLLIQVPLKQKNPGRMSFPGDGAVLNCAPQMVTRSGAGNVENAVIGHGKVEGPYTEVDGLPIVRDERFPIRVTVQFYKATDNGIVSSEDMKDIAGQLDRVYSEAEYVGSLVTEGDTGRPTEYQGDKHQPAGWWPAFEARYRENFGEDWTGLEELWRELDLQPR